MLPAADLTQIITNLTVMLCAGAKAQTLTECGRSDGYAYYFSGGLITSDKSGLKRTVSTVAG